MALPHPDADIVRAAQQGDDGAWRVLYRTWAPVVLGWCAYLGGSAIDREEAAHETFVRLHQVLGKLDDLDRFPSFLYGVVRRVVLEQRRRSWWRRFVPDFGSEPASTRPSPEHQLHLDQTTREVERVLDALPEAHREVLLLCRVQGHTDAEVSALLGIPANTVRSRLARAQKAFDERCKKRGLVPVGV